MISRRPGRVATFDVRNIFVDLPIHQINSAQSHSTQIYSSSKSQQLQVTRKLQKRKRLRYVFDHEVRNFKTRLTEQSLHVLACHAKSTFKSRKENILDRYILFQV